MENELLEFGQVLHPTEEEFADFQGYMNKIEKNAPCGIIKVVPPEGYKATETDYEELMKGLKVTGPIEQNFNKRSVKGIYELVLIQKKSMKVLDYRKRVQKYDEMTDGLDSDKVEKMYWRSLSFNPPLYGADVLGSLFDKGVDWNLAELPGILEDGLGKVDIMGINTPYFYFGSWRTTFAWHCEDLDLPSINYLHYGKPKFWYGVHPDDADILEEVAQKFMPDSFHKCNECMRHKTVLINPYLLKKVRPDIRIVKQIQRPGEFIISLPKAYHCGFNWGFNIAEAVNFGSLNWIQTFTQSGVCQCEENNVSINASEFYKNLISNNPKLKSKKSVRSLRKQLKDLGELTTDDELEMEIDLPKKRKKRASARKAIAKTKKTRKTTSRKSTNKVKAKKKINKKVIKAKKRNGQKRRTTTKIKKKSSKKDIDNWAQCEGCYKWRKVTGDDKIENFKDSFICGSLEDTTCQTLEEKWRRHYKTLSTKVN